MGKPIRITQEHIEETRREFELALANVKLADGKFSYTKTFGSNDKKAVVYFTSDAWTKMVVLIHEFSDEVAWHGLARRSDDPVGYIIYDILVYPQEVTGATVNTDQEKYQSWLMAHDDDVFNNIRMQGHSHVNMGTTPSGVDTTHQQRILDQLDDSMFYIFMIWNKRFDSHTKIYDLAKNTLYENGDVSVQILDNGIGLDAFIEDAKSLVVKKTYTSHSYGYSPPAASTPYNPVSQTGAKKEKTKTTPAGTGYQQSRHSDYWRDDADDIYDLRRY